MTPSAVRGPGVSAVPAAPAIPAVPSGPAVPAVAGLVLAAGEGRRFGRPKAGVRWRGLTLAEHACRALRGGGCAEPIRAVVADGSLDCSARLTTNPAWREGMGSSLRLGLRQCAGDAVVVTLADTPLVTAEHVRRLVGAWSGGARVAVATYGGVRRTPVLLGREHWSEVSRRAVGDVGARAFLDAHPDLVVAVECGDLGPWRDVDTPQDFAALET